MLLLMAATDVDYEKEMAIEKKALHTTETSCERNTYDEEDIPLLMAHTDSSKSTNPKVWYLDSGCSNHMSGNRDCLLT